MASRSGSTKFGWAARLGIAAFFVFAAVQGAAAAKIYEQIRVPYDAGTDPGELFFHPDLEVMGEDDGAWILLSTPELTSELRARGFDVEVQIPDLEGWYTSRSYGPRDGLGIWHSYSETVEEMNLLHSQYPNLTTAPASIATTGQGRTVWAMKISDNPGVQENEPEVLFDGMHHAREIMTVEVLLHFMRYLCENYGTDPVVTFLVDNRQVWFVPILNVDGFVYNEQTNPNGGGMWRKNRRLNSGGCYGVDLNRNYPFEWVGSGSSPDPCSDTYRGPSAGSEPELQGLMALIDAHEFVTWQSYHSVAGMVLLPWGYTSQHTPDDATFRAIANEMASANGYAVGQPPELLYPVNGGSIDWGYGATTDHPKIFAFTTEVDGTGFWPDPSERDGLIAENLHANLYLCQIAGAYLELSALVVSGGDGNGRLDPGESASLVATVRNPGVLVPASNVQVSLACQDPYVRLTDAQAGIGAIPAGGSGTNGADPFDLTIDPSCPAGRDVNFTVLMEADGGLRIESILSLRVGQAPTLFSTDFEPSGSEWFSDPTHNAQTGAFVRIDPVQTPFQPGDDTTPAPGVYGWITAQNPSGAEGTDDVDGGTSASRSPVINLAGQSHARLDLRYFFGQRDSGDDPTDGFRIDLSNDGGATFPANLLLIGDVQHSAVWMRLQANLEEHLALTSQMVIRLQATDGTVSGDIIEAGVDDVYIFEGTANEPPSAPMLVSPPDGAGNQPSNVALVVANAVDPEGDALTYGFRVYSDAWMTQLVATVDGVAEGAGGTTSWTVSPALAQATYWWRAYAEDADARGLYMTPATFTVSDPTGIAEGTGVFGATLSAMPNPANGAVRIRYYTPASPSATLEIFDLAGRRVRSLDAVRWAEGWHEVSWDGRDGDGAVAPSGVYWIRLVLPTETRTVRVIQLR